MRRARRLLLAAFALVVILIGGGFAVFALRGSDAPPRPQLSAPAAAAPEGSQEASAAWVVTDPSFVGYRVREEFVTVGVIDAVGRTGEVSGTATVENGRVTAAELETDMTTLRSDESRRDNALRSRGIETDAYPTSRFELTEPFAIQRRATRARGRLTLHGQTRPITATVQSQRLDDATIELAGEAPIDFEAFAIEPPSVAGFVTVEDQGTLEFKLRLTVR